MKHVVAHRGPAGAECGGVALDRCGDRINDGGGDREHDNRRHPASRMPDRDSLDRLGPLRYCISHVGPRLAHQDGMQLGPIELLSLVLTSELLMAPSATLHLLRICV